MKKCFLLLPVLALVACGGKKYPADPALAKVQHMAIIVVADNHVTQADGTAAGGFGSLSKADHVTDALTAGTTPFLTALAPATGWNLVAHDVLAAKPEYASLTTEAVAFAPLRGGISVPPGGRVLTEADGVKAGQLAKAVGADAITIVHWKLQFNMTSGIGPMGRGKTTAIANVYIFDQSGKQLWQDKAAGQSTDTLGMIAGSLNWDGAGPLFIQSMQGAAAKIGEDQKVALNPPTK
jgi:hypothetical protein